VLALVVCLIPLRTEADGNPSPDRILKVGVAELPPFSMKDEKGRWVGIAVDLWVRVASDLKIKYEWHESDIHTLLAEIVQGGADVIVAPIRMTPEREKLFDFTHSFYTTGLAIGVDEAQKGIWVSAMKRLFSVKFLSVVAALILLLLLVGMIVWLFERRKNYEHFGGSLTKGIGAGLWWSATTMTSVGYGDKVPITTGGRVIAVIWMYVSIIILTGFTAAMTSALTITHLLPPVQGPEDLPRLRVGTVIDSAGTTYLTANRIPFRSYQTTVHGLQDLTEGKIEAFVYDLPSLAYWIKNSYRGKLKVLPNSFDHWAYGFALPDGSPLRENINRAILKITQETEWKDTIYKYLEQ
ncbi:MAG: transporter substrate-binding domain-containing protein, partial [Deltaproteobacteria bacterium]|nr:transporter substrate-binding domain-containing protein [Deltaproteobacteria bacterium]